MFAQRASKAGEDEKVRRRRVRSREHACSFRVCPSAGRSQDRMSTETLPLPHEDVLRTVGAVADAAGIEAYAVGGAVRDAFLGRPTTDLDFVSVGPGSGIRLAEAVAQRL